ncbi:MAG: hypothetical protein ACM3MF_08445 [Anaerolineae bacterium]
MTKTAKTILALWLLLVPACGTLQIAIEQTPTANVAALSTIQGLLTQNAELATRIVSAQTGSTPSPAPQATAIVATPTSQAARITFLNGATVGTVNDVLNAGESKDYVLQASQGQPMIVYVASANVDVTVSIRRQDGTPVSRPDAHEISWQDTLRQTGDYYITVHGGTTREYFTLTVTVPSRIEFANGAVAAGVTGQTVGGYNVVYVIAASKGQKMRVELSNLSARASLSIYGFTDGQRYLRSDAGETSYNFTLPTTQDYIVVVVPDGGSVVSYMMTVVVQ